MDLKICVLIPEYVKQEDIERTYQSIKTAGMLEKELYVYWEGNIINSDVFLDGSWNFKNKDNQDFFEQLYQSDPEDVMIPLVAGDVVPQKMVQESLALTEDIDCVKILSISNSNTTMPYLIVLKWGVVDTNAFETYLKQSCIIFADYISECVKKDAVEKTVYTDEEFQTIYQITNWDKIREMDKRKVWAFCAGQYSNDFRGNPKYLYLYLNNYREDINAYWFCEKESLLTQIRHMGLPAYRIGSINTELLMNNTGVLVSEQVKGFIPVGLEHAVYLNLWHGVGGVKAVERSLVEGRLTEEIGKKYIKYNNYYRTNEMYLAPSKFIEDIACEQLGLRTEQIVRSGYPRNIYQKLYAPVETFPHNCFHADSLPDDVRFAAYIPTYRNNQVGDLFASAIPDMAKLIEVCEENHICMIFKMHPLLESELSFKQAREAYKECPWVYFWDNNHDFYEVLEQMDLCIFDYSSMFTDFMAAGCEHYIRYAFDFTGDDLDFKLDYDEATLGRKCTSYEELLQALAEYQEDDLSQDITRISNLYWEHAGTDSMERIVDSVLAYQPVKQELPTLYSFDIFDTLISRRVLEPEGIFYRVQEKMRESDIKFPSYLEKRYPFIRHNAELNMREYYTRSKVERDDERCEIQFSEIMKRIQVLYHLDDEQIGLLAKWEVEAEIQDVYPLVNTIDKVKQLVANGETVILISDMYLPKDIIQKMLTKADPILAELPLYLSSELGYQKSAKNLYIEVYRQFAPDYKFGRWIHTGDNPHSDVKNPQSLNIETVAIHKVSFNKYEKALANELQSYDGYLIAASMARFRETHPAMQDQFVYAYVALLFVPYVRWAMHSSKDTGKKNVYFISRDGHQLKKIADVINAKDGLGLNTKYIYASRRVWRIPSFFDHIDVGFWGQGYGNMAKVNKFGKLLKALDMDEKTFRQMFTELNYLNEKYEIDADEIVRLADVFKNSEKYLKYLLKTAEEERYPSCEYLKQEMDLESPCAIIEYWGRGYSQENFTRLWQYITGRKEATTFYYSRSTLPSDEDNIRMNFTSHPSSQAFIESIFACINYKTVQSYHRVDGKWLPVTEEISCNEDLFYSMEKNLPAFAEDFCALPLTDEEATGRALMDFAISWYAEHPEWEGFTKVLSQLVDSVEMFGNKTVFADPITNNMLAEIEDGKTRAQVSKNIAISYYRSEKEMQSKFMDMFQIHEGEELTSGWKISSVGIQKNQNARNTLLKRKNEQAELQKMYDDAVIQKGVEQKILLVESGNKFGVQEYGSLLKALGEQNTYSVEKICLSGNENKEFLIEKTVTARFIISIASISQLSNITLRKETKLIILGNTPIQFFYSGMIRKQYLRECKELSRFELTNDISMIQMPSDILAERAKKIYSVGSRTKMLTNGCCVTDCYYDWELRAALKEKLYEFHPEARGRIIISYLPYHRYRNGKSRYAHMLDLNYMQKILGDKYFVILHLMDAAKNMSNTVDIPNFSYNMTKQLSMREQMLLADIIVADYRDTSFEAPLAGVPVFVTCWDKKNMDKKDSIFESFENMIFGVPVDNTEELVEYLQNLDSYDHSNCCRFVEKYLTSCDGKSAQRLVDYLLKMEPEKFELPDLVEMIHRKKVAVETAPDIQVCRDLDGSSIMLYWKPVRGAEYYEVLTDNGSGCQFDVIKKVKSDSCAYRISGKDSLRNLYQVRACYENGRVLGECSKAIQGNHVEDNFISDVEEVLHSEVPSIICVIPGAKGNRLYWNGPSNVAGWRTRCCYSNGKIREVDHVQVNTWEWTDRDSNADKDTTYEICALYWLLDGRLVESSYSVKKSVDTISKIKPGVEKIYRDKFVLQWNTDANVFKYHIYRKCDARGRYEHIAECDRDISKYEEQISEAVLLNYIILMEGPKGNSVCRPVRVNVPDILSKPTGLIVKKEEQGNRVLWDSMPDVDGWNIRLCTSENRVGKKIAEVPGKQTWWLDTEHNGDVGYRIEAFRKVGEGCQFSGYGSVVNVN